MNFTEKLKEILSWIESHAKRLSRQGMVVRNPLENAQVYFLKADSVGTLEPTFSDVGLKQALPNPIMLDGQGRLSQQIFIKPDQIYRIEVKDEAGEMLFTQDHIRGDQLT